MRRESDDSGRAALRVSEVRVAGVRSPVLEAGSPGAEEAVVFVHGNPGSSRDWEGLVPRIGALGRAVAFDLPGFGKADKPEDFPYTVDGYARHLAAVLDALGIRRAHLVLHDFGGAFGLAWAAAHPDAFASVVLVDIGVCRAIAGITSRASGGRRCSASCSWRPPAARASTSC